MVFKTKISKRFSPIRTSTSLIQAQDKDKNNKIKHIAQVFEQKTPIIEEDIKENNSLVLEELLNITATIVSNIIWPTSPNNNIINQ